MNELMSKTPYQIWKQALEHVAEPEGAQAFVRCRQFPETAVDDHVVVRKATQTRSECSAINLSSLVFAASRTWLCRNSVSPNTTPTRPRAWWAQRSKSQES